MLVEFTFYSIDLGLNDDGREVKRQKLADDDTAMSMGDLTKSEITEVHIHRA